MSRIDCCFRSSLLTLVFLLPLSVRAMPPDSILYEIAFTNAVHHEAEIRVTLPGDAVDTLKLRMSRSSPGRYALHEFAKNVYNVRAFDETGKSLQVMRPDPYRWYLTGHTGTVMVAYTLFADRADGTYSGIDVTHAHLNMPATFMWAGGMRDLPIRIRFHVPEQSNWRVATQLQPTANPLIFTAPNLDYFMDSPAELSHFTMREWPVESNGRQATVRLALHHDGTEAEADAYTAMARRVVLEQEGIFGELPAFDFGSYTFIADYLPYVAGDGMEHRNSTIIVSIRPLRTGALRNLSTLAHEFFHSWNVERIRPRALEPFDFERANMCGELWFAEGFTSYYTPLTLIRAGLTDIDDFAESLERTVDFVINAPGRRFFSAVEMSMQAPFVDAATSVDPTNRHNTFISYYTFGAAIGLGLDLTMRTTFPGRSLDDLMREMWRRHGNPEQPYTNEEIQRALAAVTGDTEFARRFFDQYIYGSRVVDYAALLEPAGLVVRKKRPGTAWLGEARLAFDEQGARLTTGTQIGSPLYTAGLDREDIILELDGQKVPDRETLTAILDRHRPGEQVKIQYEQRGRLREATLVPAENPHLEIVPFEHLGLEMTAAIVAFRQQWLGTKAKKKVDNLQRYCPECSRGFDFPTGFCPFDGAALRITRE